MPEYDYKCTECECQFSVNKRIAEATREEPCPECGEKTRRVWSVPSVASSACSGGGSSSGGGGG
ncbi:MAG: zinc ribbon domain-containing protein [Coriobacteriia bacterium]|nr:zinc ribbon domain-containing protein [Coriobacteriia bacterium]